MRDSFCGYNYEADQLINTVSDLSKIQKLTTAALSRIQVLEVVTEQELHPDAPSSGRSVSVSRVLCCDTLQSRVGAKQRVRVIGGHFSVGNPAENDKPIHFLHRLSTASRLLFHILSSGNGDQLQT